MTNDAFLVLFLILIALMTIVPLFLRRLKIPAVIALLIAGMLISPNGFDLPGRLSPLLAMLGGTPETVRTHTWSLINSLGSLGLLFLMMLAGMEADFKLIRSSRRPVLMLSVLTFLLPAVSGYLVYHYFRSNDLPGKLLYASLFASHSVGIVFPIIRELRLTRTRFGAAILISTVVTDIASIMLLAVSVQMKKQIAYLEQPGMTHLPHTLSIFDYIDPAMFGNWFMAVYLLVVLAYFSGVLLIVPKAGILIRRLIPHDEDGIITCFLFLVLVTVLIGEFLGVNLIIGAFLAGLGLSKVMRSGGDIFRRFEGIGYGFLIPFLFISIGMKTDMRVVFASAGSLEIILLTVVGLVASKVFSGWLAMRLSGFGDTEGVCAGLMTVPQLSATLAAAAIGKDLGMLDNNFFNAIIILSIVTTLPVPSIVRAIIEKKQLKFPAIDADEPAAFRVKQEGQDDLL